MPDQNIKERHFLRCILRAEYKLFGWRDGGEERAEAFGEGWVGEDGVAENGVGVMGDHGDLDNGHNLSGAHAECSEAEYAVAFGVYEGFHVAAGLGKCTSSEVCGHGNFCKAIRDIMGLCFGFAEANACEFGVDEEAKGDKAASRGAFAPGNVVEDNAMVVFGDVREIGTAGAVSNGPDVGCGGLQVLVDLDMAAGGGFDVSEFEADVLGIGYAAACDEEM